MDIERADCNVHIGMKDISNIKNINETEKAYSSRRQIGVFSGHKILQIGEF